VVEDIIAPSLRRLASEELGCGKELFFAVRLSKTRPDDPTQSREFDAFFVGEKAVLLNESKAMARPEYAQAFVEFLLSPNAEGVIRSQVFPGLHLAVTALLAGDLTTVLAEARQGTETEEHATFVERLSQK
jgi:ABC-type Fe3+ transport system substrate-binding protein